MIIKEERWNRAVVWDNYKAGVIDTDTGKVIVPIQFDELYWRVQTFSSPGRGVPPKPSLLVGFACFTDEGEAVAYDADGNIDDWKDWESGCLSQPEPPKGCLDEIEQEIIARFNNGEGRDELSDLLYDRKWHLNYKWKHSPEHVQAISAVNDRLNAAVREALAMGERLEKTLSGEWELTVEVYPEWEDESIQNIIVELGRRVGIRDYSPCFSIYTYNGKKSNWDFKTATLDDGNSWDEGPLRRPAYQDCYFLHPFQQLYYDNYILAFKDLLSIKSFQIRVLINKTAES